MILVFGLYAVSYAADEISAGDDPDHAVKRTKGLLLFRTEIRDLLKDRCVHCHGGEATEAKFDLSDQEGLLKGGERGPAVVIGRGDKSLILRLIAHQQEPRMPKNDTKMTARQIQSIAEWIDLGAPYDEPLVLEKRNINDWIQRTIPASAKNHWSFKTLEKWIPPQLKSEREWGQNPVDDFVMAKLQEAKLHPNPRIAQAPLIRRLFFDIIGLPPKVEEVESFVLDDRPDAYERQIDQLLANPHYGERWGRRWLDLVRFAESHGFEHDYDRASAFHYRDFVVQALNAGMAYDQFVRWQIAGDEIAPNDRLALMATGYLAAGVHSTQITKSEVEKHRYDEMDDMLSTIGTSLLGLTVGCARCHDHKFDAIPQADYYRLLSTFTTTIRSEVVLDFDPIGYQLAKADFDLEHAPFQDSVQDFEVQQLPQRFARWMAHRDASADHNAWLVPEAIQWKSQGNAIFSRQADESWLVTGPNAANDIWTISFETNLKEIRSLRIEALADATLTQSGPGRATNGNFALSDCRVSIRPLGAAPESNSISVKWRAAKATFEQNGLPVNAAIDDDPNSAWAIDPEFGKNHAAVFIADEPFGFDQGTIVTVTLKFGVNTQHGIGRPRLTISRMNEPEATTGGSIAEAIQSMLSRPFGQLTWNQQKQILDWYKPQDNEWKILDERRSAHAATAPKPCVQNVLVATEGLPPIKLHTQAESEFLNETHFLWRGETNHKEGVASQSYLQVLMANPDSPKLYESQPPPGWRTSFRRTSLTNWLVDREAGAGNLLARVITNRIWQNHLGRGIVSTPSDFGTRGDLPTHPELLDWLALELVRHQWELKPIHRLILQSSTYQQSSEIDESRSSLDQENRFYWHRPRRRLEAEIIRDAILAISDQFNDRLYGPGHLDEGHRRRSLYFTMKRSQLIPSMAVFDAPNGTTPVAERPQTTIAPQALLLMNNPHVRAASRQLAVRLQPIAIKSPEVSVRLGYQIALSRSPSDDEMNQALMFIRNQASLYKAATTNDGVVPALADFCQILFCLNEFIYIE